MIAERSLSTESNYFLLASFDPYTANILESLASFFNSMKLKKSELMKKVKELKKDKKDNKKFNLEIDKTLQWISTAEEKLHEVEKIFQECTKTEKK